MAATTLRGRGRRSPARALIAPGSLIMLVALTSCGLLESGGGAQPPSPSETTETASASPSESVTGSPLPPSGSPASPSGPSPTPGSSTVTPSGSVAPVTCTSVTPIRVEKVTSEPRRTLETVTLVSDGRNLTPGTREQTDFLPATLTAPDGTVNTDEATLTKIGTLIASSSRNRVLLTRPNPPDEGADASTRPYNTPGTFVAYSASATLNADVVVDCSGQEQRWLFRAEADQTLGVVNCAVEPPRSNAVARLVYTNNC
jgi:hypothetical protein